MNDFDVVTWRPNLFPGEAAVIYSPKMLLNQSPAAFTLPDGFTLSMPIRYGDQPWLGYWAWAVNVAADVKPGDYGIAWKDWQGVDHATTLTVLKPLKETNVSIKAGASAKTINAAIAKAKPGTRLVVWFAPGNYDLDADLIIPDACDVAFEGEGYATFSRSVRGDEYGNRIIGLDAGPASFTARGLTFRNLGFDNYALHGFPWYVGRLDLIDCTFERCQMIGSTLADDPASSLLADRCKFGFGSGTGPVPAGTFLDWCEFRGPTGAGQHSCFNPGVDRVLMLNCDWHGTNRGIVQQQQARGCFGSGLRFFNVAGGQVNGSEVILLESGSSGASGINAYVWCHLRGCDGPGISLQGTGHTGNTFHGLVLGCRGQSIHMAHPGTGDPISGNAFRNVECDGVVELYGDCRQNQIAAVVRDFPRSSGNQEPQPWRAGCYGSGMPFTDKSTSGDNDFAGSYVAMPQGLMPLTKGPRKDGTADTPFGLGEVVKG